MTADFVRDLKFTWRMHRRTPIFTAAATLVLAVAIGVATAVFSLYSYLELQPVPGVRASDRLVSIGLAREDNDWIPLTIDQYAQVAETLETPEAVVGVGYGGSGNMTLDGVVLDDASAAVSAGFFRGLGVPMLHGVDLDSASADPETPNIVISESFWERHFDRELRALGTTVKVFGEHDFTIVGIAGNGFRGLRRNVREDAWIPAEAFNVRISGGPPGLDEVEQRAFARRLPMLSAFARLPAGTEIAALNDELQAATARLREQWSSLMSAGLMRLEALPGSAANPRAYRALVRNSELLAGGALLVLLVASLNLASFFIARAPARMHELRTRMAIGATRGALARQMFVEAGSLVAVGAALGGLIHIWLRALLLRVPPFVDVRPAITAVESDWRVFAFLTVAAAVVAVIAGLAPALRVALQPSLVSTTSSAVGRHGTRWQPLLVLQVFVATLVVVAGSLFVGELQRLERVELGFEPNRLFVSEMGWDREAARSGQITFTPDMGVAFEAAVTERIASFPGVEAYAFASQVPFDDGGFGRGPGVVELVGDDRVLTEHERSAYEVRVTPDYFRVIGATMVSGRVFALLDGRDAVVSQAFARKLFGTTEVLGRQFQELGGGGFNPPPGVEIPPITIIGVVDDVIHDSTLPPEPIYYTTLGRGFFGGTFVARGDIEASLLAPLLDELVRKHMSPRIVESIKPMRELMHEAIATERARSRLALGAGLLALVLTMIGLYASMQHTVEARRGELAVRKAIGASDVRLVTMIMRRALAIIALGAVTALLVAVVFAERLSALLFGLDATHPWAWGAAIAVVGATGVLAAWLPARRAGKVDPAVSLRYE